MTRYLLAGGGTAGHVNPLLATADALRERDPAALVLVLGTAEGLESRLVPARGYELLLVDRLPMPRRPSATAAGFPARLAGVVTTIRRYLRDHRIDVVVGFGGYVAAPAYLAARLAGVPVVLHESNARAGVANRLGSRFTRYSGVAYPGTGLPHGRLVGMPLRREIERLDRPAARADAMAEFDLDPGRPTLLVTGGSLGARRINETIAASVPRLLAGGWQVLHITGTRSEIEYPDLAGYRVLPYCDRMDLAIAAADLAVARSGSSTVSELTAVGVPAVYVPLPIGNGEQRLNARQAVSAGAATLVADGDFLPGWVEAVLVPLMDDRDALETMAARAREIGVRDGTERMLALIDDATRSRRPR